MPEEDDEYSFLNINPRILVTGGRDFGLNQSERDFIWRVLYQTFPQFEPDQYGNTLPRGFLAVGDARGVDTAARNWAVVNWLPHKVWEIPKSDWTLYGRGAGPRRNGIMLVESKPALVLAFPGGNGTADMIQRARDAKVEVRIAKQT